MNARRVMVDPLMLYHYIKWRCAQNLTTHPSFKIGDCRLAGFPNFSSYWGAWNHQPNYAEIGLMERLPAGSRALLEVGANMGIFSMLLSKRHPNATIHAFEPISSTYTALLNNIRLNQCSNVIAHQMAIADHVGNAFMTDTKDPATNRLIDQKGTARDTVPVLVSSIDHFCDENKISELAFLKIDVEGAEPLVLKGATQLLRSRKIGIVLLEVSSTNLRRHGRGVEDLMRPLAENGYGLFLLKEDGTVGAPQSLRDLQSVRLVNIVAAAP